MLIQTATVAINHPDAKMTGSLSSPGCTAGGDRAGVVVAMDPDVPPDRFIVGDRVCAPNLFMNPFAPHDGAFQ